MSFRAIFLIAFLVSISCTSFYVLNDIHYDPFYSPNLTPLPNMCRPDIQDPSILSHLIDEFPLFNTSTHLFHGNKGSIYGQFGCDSPYELIKVMLDEVLEKNSQPDIIYLPGDFVGHGYSQDAGGNFSNQTYEVLLNILYNVSAELKIRFPNTLIIPAVGNNDPEFHYQVPDVEEKYSYYDFLFETWFLDHEPNSKLSNLNQIKSTFLDGGYYRVDYSDSLSIFSLNTVYFSKKNDNTNDPGTALNQMNWLSSHLADIKANDPNRKVIITYHIIPGYKYNGSGARMWNDTYAVQFDQLVQDYNDIIVTVVAAHVHSNSLRAYKLETSTKSKSRFLSLTTKPSYGPTIVCPSVTPIYLNNPGFTLIDIEEESNGPVVENVVFTYLNLDLLNNDSKLHRVKDLSPYFFDILVKSEYGLADFSAESIGDLIIRMKTDDNLVLKYLAYSLGFQLEEPYYDQALNVYAEMGLVTGGNGTAWSLDSSERDQFICTLKHIKQDDYKSCNS